MSSGMNEPACDAAREELDDELVADFLGSARERNPRGLGRCTDDAELLHRAGVTAADGIPTVAGLLALGVRPQQWFPRYVIQAAAEPLMGDPATTITGPIPRMLDEAMAWARRTFDTVTVSEPDGTVGERPSYPYDAFRELIANALVHRDLGSWSEGMAVEVRHRRDRLVVSNPGGSRSARNAQLASICRHVRSPETGEPVIQASGTGLLRGASPLVEAGLPPAQCVDDGTRFTAALTRPA